MRVAFPFLEGPEVHDDLGLGVVDFELAFRRDRDLAVTSRDPDRLAWRLAAVAQDEYAVGVDVNHRERPCRRDRARADQFRRSPHLVGNEDQRTGRLRRALVRW